ncbi:hypothetical protein BGX33_011920 [Mortierella sp. NVP41]|nr:hypothetical protein BGX33_011920 [Mortierella sp. NVP41]
MQQDRLLRAFSEPHGGLGYRRSSAVKEGFEEQWGNQIGEDQEEEDVAQSRPAAGDLRREEDEYDHTRRVRRQKQRQQQEQEEMMETDSFMDTDKNGDGDGDEDMNPHTKLQLARKAKEDAIRSYQEAGRTLQRAQEREEAILFEYEAEMFEVDVESSASQQHLRHGHGSHQPSQMFDHGHAYERARRSSPASAAAAAAAVTFQIQDDNNNEAMLRSRIVPQVSDTPSNYSETPRPHTIDFLPSRVMAPPPSSPPPVPSESVISDNIDHHHQQRQGLTPFMTTGTQVPNQTRGSSQVRSRSQSKGNEDAFSSHVQHDPISPCVKIKSEEHDELLFKKQLPNVGEYQPDETTQRPGPRYKDYNVPIEIPSSVGSDVGMGTGQPESSGAAQRRGERGGKARAVPDRWRAPTPVPPSIQARRGGGRQQGSARDSRPILGVRPGAFKVVPVDLLGDRAYSQQPQASSSRPVLLSPRSFVPRPRPYPPPPPVAQGRGQVQSNAPGGGGAGRGFPPNFFARGTPARPPPPPPPPAPQQRRGPVGVAPMAAASTGSPTAAAAPSPMPGYSSSTSSPRMPWQFPDFVDENGYPYPAVFFYTHIERVDHFYHQHHPMSISSRDTSLSPRHRASPNFFASHAGGGGGGGGGMEDVLEYEDMAMDGDVQPGRPRSRSQRRAQGSDDVGEEGERKPTAKAESPLF